MPEIRKQGDFLRADFFDNVGGINTTDSPFRVRDSQATGGANFDYTATGGFKKRLGHTLLNSTPSLVTRTVGTGMFADSDGNKTLLRATSSVLQTVNQSTGAQTSVTEDTVSAGTTPFSTTKPAVFSQFDTVSSSATWIAGGGQSPGSLIGYNGTTYTNNGVSSFETLLPSATITVTSGGSGGTSLGTGIYNYAVVAYKASTDVTSNATLDVAYSSVSGNYADIQLSTLTGYDTTKYTQIWIYRSSIGGSLGFTAGDLVAKIAYNGSTYTVESGGGSIVSTSKYRDNGSYLSTSISVPRADSTSLDNSTLPTDETFTVLTTYRRRLVTAAGSTLYFSDINKPESWPTTNTITVPSGGPITALAVINFNTATSTDINEILVIFKERELWVVKGNTFVTLSTTNVGVISQADISLIFIDYVGCPAQSIIVPANGFIFWIDYRGMYLWDGSNKPIYCSRLLEYDFSSEGDFDLTQLQYTNGVFLRRQNMIIWFMSSKTAGVNKLAMKLDLRLSLSDIDASIAGRILEAVLVKDTLSYDVYGSVSTISGSSELLFAAGSDGKIWKMYDNFSSDSTSPIEFSYLTKTQDMGSIGNTKRFNKVIVWCQEGNLNDLTLNFWTGYRILDEYKSTMAEPITSLTSTSIWDQDQWDVAIWDQTFRTYNPVVFNLSSADFSTEGEAITLEFAQSSLQSPLVIAGYSILYTEIGLRS